LLRVPWRSGAAGILLHQTQDRRVDRKGKEYQSAYGPEQFPRPCTTRPPPVFCWLSRLEHLAPQSAPPSLKPPCGGLSRSLLPHRGRYP
jgi:hypothetical protein